jgi:hypothetical protein
MQRKKEKGTMYHGLASTWPSCLGRLGLGWQPRSKTGEAGEPRCTAAPTESGGLPVARGVGVGRRSMMKWWGTDLRQRRNRRELTGRCP